MTFQQQVRVLQAALASRDRAKERADLHLCKKCEEDRDCLTIANLTDRLARANAKVIALGGDSLLAE